MGTGILQFCLFGDALFRFASLVRYLYPTDEELRQFAPAPFKDKKEKKKVIAGS